jgi:hypothetical protein
VRNPTGAPHSLQYFMVQPAGYGRRAA